MKTSRTYFVIFILMLFASTALMGSCVEIIGVQGDGDVVKENRQVSGFTSLEVGGAFNVYLTQGKTESLTLEADKNLMELIVTEVKGDKLHIYTKEKIKKATELNVYLTFEELEMIDISGAVSIEGEGVLQFDELHLDGSGACEIRMELKASSLHADFSGASEIELSGTVATAGFDISGASEIDALDCEITDCKVDVSGAADAKVNVKANLEISVSGAATVRYKGDPHLSKEVSGAGSVKKY